MELRPRNKAPTKKTSVSRSRTVLGDVANRLEPKGYQNKRRSTAVIKTRGKIINASNPDNILENTNNGTYAQKKNNPQRRVSLRLSVKRKGENLDKEERQIKRKRKEYKQPKVEGSKPKGRRSHSCGRKESKDKRKLKEDEVQSFLVHPRFRLRRPLSDGKALTLGVAAHDRKDEGNELQIVPYVTDLFQHLFRQEEKYRPQMYMGEQNDINSKMRAILIDWLVEVHMKFRLVSETLYLCVNIIDRYCYQVAVKRSQLQLVGVTALLIACKYEEIYPPEVNDCVFITDNAYTREEVLDMEQKVVHKLRFNITVPTAYPFLQRFLNVVKASTLIKHAATYYTERTLQEYDLNKYRPSVVSASAVILAINNPDICQRDEFNTTLVCGMPTLLLEYTGFKANELQECAKLIAVKVGEEPITASKRKLFAVKRKYENRKYMHVSAMRQPTVDFIITDNNKNHG